MKRYYIEMESSRTATINQLDTLKTLGYRWEVESLHQNDNGEISATKSYYAYRADDALKAYNQVAERIPAEYRDMIRIIPHGGNVRKSYISYAPDVYHYNDGTRPYNNRGQYLEYCYRVAKTGQTQRADNVSAKDGTDCNGVSVKSARASYAVDITDKDINPNMLSLAILRALVQDKAEQYVYLVPENEKIACYKMNKATFHELLLVFAALQAESKSNGRKIKMRLPRNDKAMIEWLECGGNTQQYIKRIENSIAETI